ncbi:MAG: hypothetical protein JWR27_1460 [Aeromicrobium sp.]|nr:hypothetical protein [Aeromicrobium sp.]
MTTQPPLPPPFPPAPTFRPPLPRAPHATLAMVLGIVSIGGFFTLLVPVFLAPVAWYLGAAARRRIEREPGSWSGGGEARTGLVLGMVGTGLMVIALFLTALILLGLVLVSHYDAGYGA